MRGLSWTEWKGESLGQESFDDVRQGKIPLMSIGLLRFTYLLVLEWRLGQDGRGRLTRHGLIRAC